MQILCSGKACAKPFTPEHDLDEMCHPCKRLEAARTYSRERRRRVYHEEVKADPYLKKQHSLQSARSYRKAMEDPERRARHLESRRRYYQRLKQDEKRWAAHQEAQRKVNAAHYARMKKEQAS